MCVQLLLLFVPLRVVSRARGLLPTDGIHDNGLVERFNRSLLQLLRAPVDKQTDWEQYQPLVLYAYRTSAHSSTGVAPFVLMFGRQPKCIDHSSSTAFDSDSYPAYLRAKLAELWDLVESNLVQAAEHQKTNYDLQFCCRTFRTGDLVWLSRLTAGKLDPRWEGNWSVKAVKSPCNVEITDGQRTRVVHVNRLRHWVQPTANTVRQLLTLDMAHNKAGIHLRLNMFCFPHPASHHSLHSPLGVIRREGDGHPIASHKLEVEL